MTRARRRSWPTTLPAWRRTYLAVAGFDPLCDEGLAYAARLREAGNELTLARARRPGARLRRAHAGEPERARRDDRGMPLAGRVTPAAALGTLEAWPASRAA